MDKETERDILQDYHASLRKRCKECGYRSWEHDIIKKISSEHMAFSLVTKALESWDIDLIYEKWVKESATVDLDEILEDDGFWEALRKSCGIAVQARSLRNIFGMIDKDRGLGRRAALGWLYATVFPGGVMLADTVICDLVRKANG